MRKLILCIYSLLFFTGFLFAGDIATLVNLGFSGDGRYYMFGQYGYAPEKGSVYSELYIVDVPRNVFVSGGSYKGEYSVTLEPGQSASGGLYNLMEKAQGGKKKYGIDYLKSGRLLYLKVDDAAAATNILEDASSEEGEDAEGLEPTFLDFRDFVTGSHYRMDLVQNVEGSGAYTSSSFYINLDITGYDGLKQTYTIGHPNYKRKGIKDYAINRVLVGPKNKSLIIVISKKDMDNNIRFMVETVKLK